MQFKGATNLELRLSECIYRCETELPASELETTIVSCLGDAMNELQRLRKIIVSDLNIVEFDNYPKPLNLSPWANNLTIGWKLKSNDQYYVRWTGVDGIDRWLHPVENRWVDEHEQKSMPTFTNYASAQLAANKSPKPPTWEEFNKGCA